MLPQRYDIRCDLCGGVNLNWSEFEHLIWCYDCKKDTKGVGGVFDGPIPVRLCLMLGLSFDRIDLQTGERLYMRECESGCEWSKEKPKKGAS